MIGPTRPRFLPLDLLDWDTPPMPAPRAPDLPRAPPLTSAAGSRIRRGFPERHELSGPD